ncbi:MAG: glycosyltransferase family 4 protein [Gammaproteobacteria bacterium]|nr:glycosyltransferase family 4 protein [Gammaproteobacteria bacterium]MDJ0871643.1 glycosyltransferase family 4 protein [Gammaproteobacteria bacterium]
MAPQSRRIAFVATRIHGTDGVSLEIKKWAEVLEELGHTCFYVSGECDRPPALSEVIPEAHFEHPIIREINGQAFGRETRSLAVSNQVRELTGVLKQGLRSALARFDIDLIIAENCVTIPMNIPLGLAVVETVMETGIQCIAHHHDFIWERERYLVNAVDDYLKAAFPPMLRQMEHVAINTQAASEFSRRTGLPCRVIPNVMDFDNPPLPLDEYSRDFRETIGVGPDDVLILQPTRVIQRKGIENTVELASRLSKHTCKLVLTHAAGDEGDDYPERVQKYARLLDVDAIYADRWISSQRGRTADGEKLYTIWDAYAHADFVGYPSCYEGFGNAFLEAVYCRKPVLCNRYAIYRTDIEPCGFRPVLMDGFLTDDVVAEVNRVLSDERYRSDMVEHNYHVGHKHFAYGRVAAELLDILADRRSSSRRESPAQQEWPDDGDALGFAV